MIAPPLPSSAEIRQRLPITGIMACDPDGAIGVDGGLPWDIPQELEFFRNTTRGHVVIMGRKTFESFPEKAREQRTCVVISSTLSPATNALTYPSVDAFILNALRTPAPYQNKESFFIGGAKLAEEMIERGLVARFLVSQIKQRYNGDTHLDLSLLRKFPYSKTIQNFEAFDVVEYSFTKS
jgi:dihydrofolate reductase